MLHLNEIRKDRRKQAMAIVQNLYQVFKLKASALVENNCNMTYAVNQGIHDGNVVAIGDNIIFQQLRYMRNDFRDYKEIYNYTSELRKTARKLRKQGKYANASLRAISSQGTLRRRYCKC